MILAELEIDDFKQFAGSHHFRPAEAGVIGIIGANGVGKTTLFEAIEWCLYNPRDITSDEIPPRGKAGKPRVRVVLHDPATDVRYVVERRLRKSGAADAEIYREDQSDSRITHGSRQVTEYVTRNLIGLGHRAFVSTFFTRQKELTFFGALTGTERRREVGRLLGLETIRTAQRQIGEERAAASSEAKVLRAQHEEQSKGRNFLTEAEQAERVVAEQQAAAATAETTLTGATEARDKARRELGSQQELERKDAEVRRRLERIAGDERAAAARRDSARRALAELDQAAATRIELAAIAATEAASAEAVREHEAAFAKHAERERLLTEADRAAQGLAKTGRDLAQAVKSAEAESVPGWAWTSPDEHDPAAGAARLIALAEQLDTAGAQATAIALATCHGLARARDQAEAKFKKVDQHLAELQQQRDQLVATGDPRQDAAAAQVAREAALQSIQEASTTAQNARKTRDELAPIVKNLESRRFENNCPVCGRPFSEHEAAITLAALNDRIDDLGALIVKVEKTQRDAERTAEASDKSRQAAEGRRAELDTLDGRISQGRPIVEEARQTWVQAFDDCVCSINEHRLDGEPTARAVAEARARADMLQRVTGLLPLLRQLRGAAEQRAADADAVRQAIAAIGPIAYDAAAHKAAKLTLERSQAARAQIEQIDQDLARRPDRLVERDAAEADLKRHAGERAAHEAELTTIGFDSAALDTARATEQAALAEERAALDARNAAQTAHREAVTTRDHLLAEHQRIAGLVDRADARQRHGDILDQMYREFTLFDQFVAARITPQLAEHTSELLEAVTEGKYDRVDFDENYGIDVYDGPDEKFAVEEFSGGERDVIALCARLALSRLIGSQATHPPGFLVLDEVFGSLDRERRAQVLDMLGALSGTAEAFQQLFIISHVDDVRLSPIFGEVWRVAETADGVSRLENLALTGGVEEV